MSGKLARNEEGSQNCTGKSADDSLATRLSTVVMTPCSDPSLDDDEAAKAFSRQSSSDAKLNQTSDQPEHPGTAAKQDSSNSTADEDQQAATFSEQLSSSGTAAAASPAIGTPVDANTAAAPRSNSAGPGKEIPTDVTTLAFEDMSLGREPGAAMDSSAAEKAEGSSNRGKAGAKAMADVHNRDLTASCSGAGSKLVTGLSRNQELLRSKELLHRHRNDCTDEEYITELERLVKDLEADNASKEAKVRRINKEKKCLEKTVGEHTNELTCLRADINQMIAEQREERQLMSKQFLGFIDSVERSHERMVQNLERKLEAERVERTKVIKQHEASQLETGKTISELRELIVGLQKRNELLTECLHRYRESDPGWRLNPQLPDVSMESVQATETPFVSEQDEGQRRQEIAAIQAIVVQQGEHGDDLMSRRAVLTLSGSKQCMVLNRKITSPCRNVVTTANTTASTTTTASIAGAIHVQIVDGDAARTHVAQRIGLTEDRLAMRCNHVCLHLQIARYFAEGRVAIIPDWNMAEKALCPLQTMRMAVLDEQLLLDPVQHAIVLGESSSVHVANLHGRALFIADEDMPSSDVLAVNIWYTFRKALEDGRRLPKIDPVTQDRLSLEFATVTDELFEHMCSLCTALFEEAVSDQRLRRNFVKAMDLENAAELVKRVLH